MSEKKKTIQDAKIVPMQTKVEQDPFSTTNPMSNDPKSSEVFFNVLLQLDQLLNAHFQNSTKAREKE